MALKHAWDETGDGAEDDGHREDQADAAERHTMDGLRSAVFRFDVGLRKCGFCFQSFHGAWKDQVSVGNDSGFGIGTCRTTPVRRCMRLKTTGTKKSVATVAR